MTNPPVRRPLLSLLSIACIGGALLHASAPASELRRSPIVELVGKVRPSIVNIHGEKTLGSAEGRGLGEPYRRVNGMGTGIVIDARGYILTNHHVVDGVRQIQVTLADGRTLAAAVIARDAATDLAIIKINTPEKLPVIGVGTSSDLMLGESVVAVGNAYGYEHTVTRGIISALHRSVQVTDAQSYEDLIQTDASINPGNSGGPLLNIDGELIGVVVAVRAGAQGIGFAIPIDNAMAVAAEMLSAKRIGAAWHGLVAAPASGGSGFIVERVEPGSPAEQAGLKPGDVIRSLDDLPIARALDLERALLDKSSGETVEMEIDRDHQRMQLGLVLAPAPARSPIQNDPLWRVLGLKLKPIPAKQFEQYQTRYRGGLAVSDVRPESPASRQGIRVGDILVGMHVWETVSLDNVSYILNRSDFAELEPLKFYILRGRDTLYGHMTVSLRDQR